MRYDCVFCSHYNQWDYSTGCVPPAFLLWLKLQSRCGSAVARQTAADWIGSTSYFFFIFFFWRKPHSFKPMRSHQIANWQTQNFRWPLIWTQCTDQKSHSTRYDIDKRHWMQIPFFGIFLRIQDKSGTGSNKSGLWRVSCENRSFTK